MTRMTMPRRNLLATGACALVGAVTLPGPARAGALGGPDLTNEEIIRKWYAALEKKDLSTFKSQCWDTQVDFIGHFDLERITTGAEDAFVKYLCHTKNGKSFRNVEYLRIKNGQLESIECYFGAQSSFPSAVSTGQK